jgi:bifunctional DNase/RNase
MSSPIEVDDAVLDEAGVIIPDEEEDEVERFREFLDQVTPEDFGADS